MSEDVEYIVDDGVAYIWLNRPHLKNSMTLEMLSRIGECIALAENDDSVKAIVMRGRGGTLSTGSDLGRVEDDPVAPAQLPVRRRADIERRDDPVELDLEVRPVAQPAEDIEETRHRRQVGPDPGPAPDDVEEGTITNTGLSSCRSLIAKTFLTAVSLVASQPRP